MIFHISSLKYSKITTFNYTNTGKGLSKMNFSHMKMLKLTRRGAGFTGISTFSCGRKFIFSHMKMFGGGALLQNGEF